MFRIFHYADFFCVLFIGNNKVRDTPMEFASVLTTEMFNQVYFLPFRHSADIIVTMVAQLPGIEKKIGQELPTNV
jgi:hypothetical protein